jgi:hypothetical protein
MRERELVEWKHAEMMRLSSYRAEKEEDLIAQRGLQGMGL